MRNLGVAILFILYHLSAVCQNTLQLEWVNPIVKDTIYHGILSGLSFYNGKFVLAGSINKNDTALGCLNCDSTVHALLLVTDTNGNIAYHHEYGGNADLFFQFAQYDIRGNIWALGYFHDTIGSFADTTSKIIGIVKFDSNYHPLWYHFYGSGQEDGYVDFTTTSDGGALILSRTMYAGGDVPFVYGTPFNYSAYLCKIDSDGNTQWLRVLGGSRNQYTITVREFETDIYSVLILTNSVDDMLTGLNFDSLNVSPWLLKIDTGGHILESRVVHNLGSFQARDLIQLPEGNIVFGGGSLPLTSSDFCSPGMGDADFALLEIDSGFQRQWCKLMGGSGNDDLYYMSMIDDSDIVLLGNSESIDGDLARCSADGRSPYHGWLGLVNIYTHELMWGTSFCCSKDVLPKGMTYDSVSHSLYVLMFAGNDGDFASAAINGAPYNNYLFKYRVVAATGINELSNLGDAVRVFPNPAQDYTTVKYSLALNNEDAISLQIMDVLGQMVYTQGLSNNNNVQKIDVSLFATGLYTVYVKRGGVMVAAKKLVKE